MGGSSYAYDGAGNRISQTVGVDVTKYLLDLQPGLATVLQATQGSDVTRYLHAPRGIHAQQDASGDWTWMLQDGLGSVRSVVDASLNPLESRLYEPYGTPFGTSGTSQTLYGFTGEQTDANGQVYLRARYYNPSIGVFTGLDPFEGVTGRPMSLNGYSRVEGNVPNWFDPSGMMGLADYALLNKWNSCAQKFASLILFQGRTLPELPEWVATAKRRICDQLCPQMKDKDIKSTCKQDFRRLCDLLCADEPRPSERSDRGNDQEHSGLIPRWLDYYQNPRGLADQSSHEHPYELVQLAFNTAFRDWNAGLCGESSATAREFQNLATRWRTEGLPTSPIVYDSPSGSLVAPDVQWLRNLFLAAGIGFSMGMLGRYAGGSSMDYRTP